MKKVSCGLGTMAILLLVSSPAFAMPSLAQRNQSESLNLIKVAKEKNASSGSSSSDVINQKFDEFVRRNSYVGVYYDSAMFVRLTGLARRHLTYKEMSKAIAAVLAEPVVGR